MGTNFYMATECESCGHLKRERHIGKSSAGWVFALHVYPDEAINNITDWIRILYTTTSSIIDEYDDPIDEDDMLSTIICRRWPKPWKEEDLILNKAIQGPNNLARAKLDLDRVIGHGEGTWDYHVGEFS